MATIALVALPACRRSETPPRRVPPIEQLARVAAASHRRVESRFTGHYAWAAFRPSQAGDATQELKLDEVAGSFLRQSSDTRSIDVLHAAGVASVLIRDAEGGVRRLREVCERSSGNAAAWNDLAAAIDTLGVERDELHRLPAALSAVDRALRLDPQLAEARFNRAVILTRLGIRNEAMRAWRDFARVERDAAWKSEGGDRLRALRGGAATPVGPELDRALSAAVGGSAEPLGDLVKRHPQEARTAVETVLLTNWAEAVERGNEKDAENALRRAALIAAALARSNADVLWRDVVQSIELASLSDRHNLAKAHLAYRDARKNYANRGPRSAEALERVARMFARMNSPMEHVARYYGANATFDSGRADAAGETLERVLSIIDANRYRSLAAGLEKQLGLCYGVRGLWTTSLRHLERSQQIFSSCGESVNAAFVEATLGEAHDRLGRFDNGWRHRVAALDVLNRWPSNSRSVPVLVGAVLAEIARGDHESALSLVQIATREAAEVGLADISAESLVQQARVLAVLRGKAEAELSLSEAKSVAAKIADEESRHRIEADIAIVEGQMLLRHAPERAVAVLSRAIQFYDTNNFGILLPRAYLERGRAHLARGARAEALADFEAGLSGIESQRANVATRIRTTLFDTLPELVGEAVTLLLAEKREAEAYAFVERARARTLIEALGISGRRRDVDTASLAQLLPPHAFLVEYAVLPDGVAAFCIGRSGMTVRILQVPPSELRKRVSEFSLAIETRKPLPDVQQRAAELYESLILPLESSIGGAEMLYIAPDRFLHALPFSALFDARGGNYLMQKHSIVITPSGAFLQRRARLERSMRPALIVADPTSSAGGKHLSAARREADVIAKLYDALPPLIGREATIERFLAAAPKSALIHYAGHAQSEDTAGGFLPLAPSPGNDGRIDATFISNLKLHETNLVILSACATMRGSITRVEGMPSLSRAFLTAGAQAVLGMLWEIDDQTTAKLLSPFHERLHQGTSPSQALQEAQIVMLTSLREADRHPASWAAAELLGVD